MLHFDIIFDVRVWTAVTVIIIFVIVIVIYHGDYRLQLQSHMKVSTVSLVRLRATRDGQGSRFLHPTQLNPAAYKRNPPHPTYPLTTAKQSKASIFWLQFFKNKYNVLGIKKVQSCVYHFTINWTKHHGTVLFTQKSEISLLTQCLSAVSDWLTSISLLLKIQVAQLPQRDRASP